MDTAPARDAAAMTSIQRMLTPQQVAAFTAIADCGSLRRAAERTGMSQPALTRLVQAMEDNIATPLLQRTKSGVRLTDAGLRLLQYAKVSQRLEAAFLHELNSGPGRLRGHVRVCGFSSVMRSAVMPVLSALARAEPGLSLEFRVEELFMIATRATRADADIAILQNPILQAGFHSLQIGEEHNLLVCADGETADNGVYIDHEPSDRFTEHYLTATGWPTPAGVRRMYFDEIYGLIDGVRWGVGRAVVPVHLLEAGGGVRQVPGTIAVRTPVYLSIATHLLELGLYRRLVDLLAARVPALLARNEIGAMLGDGISATFVGPPHEPEG